MRSLLPPAGHFLQMRREARLTALPDATSSTFFFFFFLPSHAAHGLDSLRWEPGLLDAHHRSDTRSR